MITELAILIRYLSQFILKRAKKTVSHKSRIFIIQNINVIPVINKNAFGTRLGSMRSITKAGIEPKRPNKGALNKAINTNLLNGNACISQN